jgi:hypothetical protein
VCLPCCCLITARTTYKIPVSNSNSTVACVFVAAETYLPSRCPETAVVYRVPTYQRVYTPRYDKRRYITQKFGKKIKLKRNGEVVRVEENRIESGKGKGGREEED